MPDNNKSASVYLFAALLPEAKPVIAHLNLKKTSDFKAFQIYQGDHLYLTVTGLGKAAMAAGIAYTLASTRPDHNPILLNFGIAGHLDYAIGGAYVAHKIEDVDSGKCFYPQLVADISFPSLTISSSSKVAENYHDNKLCDMEASAFFEIGTRFTSAELIQCLKVISDNRTHPSDTVTPKQVQALIAEQLPTLQTLIDAMQALRQHQEVDETPEFQQLVQTIHFSVSEQNRLKKLLNRWNVLTGNQPLDIKPLEYVKGKAFLQALEARIGQCKIDL